MNISVKINHIFTVIGVAAALVGCDDIKEADRFIPVDEVKPVRAVLIEEFTGQSCQNCPDGHRVIESLRTTYGTSVIPVSIHAGGLAFDESMSTPEIQFFKIPEGDVYFRQSGANATPAAVIDRSSGALNVAQWTAAVEAELAKPSPVGLELAATVDGQGGRAMHISVAIKPTSDITANLQVWIVESGIKSMQLDGKNVIEDYTHNHVLRAVVNGQDGEAVSAQANVFKDVDYTFELKELWVPENVSVVAFLYDKSGVLQAAEAPLTVAVD